VDYIGEGTMNLRLTVSVARTEGLPGLVDWFEKIVDALETSADGSDEMDPNLGGTTKPFTASLANSFALDISLVAHITILVAPKPITRGRRRLS
jgi:hypothetical protein